MMKRQYSLDFEGQQNGSRVCHDVRKRTCKHGRPLLSEMLKEMDQWMECTMRKPVPATSILILHILINELVDQIHRPDAISK